VANIGAITAGKWKRLETQIRNNCWVCCCKSSNNLSRN